MNKKETEKVVQTVPLEEFEKVMNFYRRVLDGGAGQKEREAEEKQRKN